MENRAEWVNKLIGSDKQIAWTIKIIEKGFDKVQTAMLEMGYLEDFKNTTLNDWADSVVTQYPYCYQWINKKVIWAR